MDGYFGCSLPPGACGCPQSSRKTCRHGHWVPLAADATAPQACPQCPAAIRDGIGLTRLCDHTCLHNDLSTNRC